MKSVRSHNDLEVYKLAFQLAMDVFEQSKSFPTVEKYSLTDQIRRSSRSVCANIAEAFRKRKYPNSFVYKLSDSEAEAAETQNWLDFALACGYLDKEKHKDIRTSYDRVIGMLVNMARKPENWIV